MKAFMKRYSPYLFCAAGLLALLVLIPRFNAAQPRGVSITRAQASRIAGTEAKRLGIPVEKAWSNLTWVGSPLLEKELGKNPDLRRRANDDPTIGPRLGGYHASYYRRGQEKNPAYGYVYVAGNGGILAARRYLRPEKAGAKATEAQLRPQADAFVHSR